MIRLHLITHVNLRILSHPILPEQFVMVDSLYTASKTIDVNRLMVAHFHSGNALSNQEAGLVIVYQTLSDIPSVVETFPCRNL